MKKNFIKLAFVAAMAAGSLQVSAQSTSFEAPAQATEFSVGGFFSDIISDIKTGFETFFSRHTVVGTCVDGTRDVWQENGFGNYIPGTMVTGVPC